MAQEKFQSFVAGVEAALEAQRMYVSRSAAMESAALLDLAGFRCRFSWAGFVLIDECVAVRYVNSATATDLRVLFADAFGYARSRNRVPLPRGMQFGYFIIPCLATEHVSAELAHVAESRPPKHWAIHEAPVVVDLSSKTVHYFQDTAMWGAFYFPYMQRLVEKVICNATASA